MAADTTTTVVVDIDAVYFGEKLKNKGILVLPACSHKGGCKFLCTNCRVYRDSHEDLQVVFENVRDNTTGKIITVMRKRRYTYIRPNDEFIRWDYTTEWAEDPNIMYLLALGFVKITCEQQPQEEKGGKREVGEEILLVYDQLVEKFVPFQDYYKTNTTVKICTRCWADAIFKENRYIGIYSPFSSSSSRPIIKN